jgi:NADH:ubiquinone oxidoreductase subunit H
MLLHFFVFSIIMWVLTSRMPNLDPETKKDLQFIWQYQVGGLTAASFFVGAGRKPGP